MVIFSFVNAHDEYVSRRSVFANIILLFTQNIIFEVSVKSDTHNDKI